MPDRKEILKFVFTVEGETEKWYLDWLEDRINESEESRYKVSIKAIVEQNPSKYIKRQKAKKVRIVRKEV